MAEQVEEQVAAQAVADDDDDEAGTPGYKAPAPKTLDEIVNQDQDDESLVRYKQMLLGGGATHEVPFPDDKRNVIVQKLSILVDDRDDIALDLTKPAEEIINDKICLKEGCEYKVQITFYVQRDIVAGLRYHQVVSRKGIRVHKESMMVGSYGPQKEPHIYKTPVQEAPKGMISRGDYKVKSKFVDDDKTVHHEWEWSLSIKKDFE
ncbi:rho GDP-dissociation inhibitor 1-like [Babylonia areolata]|uniref:rho GDP-dissociation inhibitor 1-like n=1 Tax=Babylonia areolata TaxID=304850 RepID=UPI003FD11190